MYVIKTRAKFLVEMHTVAPRTPILTRQYTKMIVFTKGAMTLSCYYLCKLGHHGMPKK